MSTNISKQKRDNLILKIKTIRTYLLNSKHDKNLDELLTYLNELEKEIFGKKYGLIYEEHCESIDLLLKTNIPVLNEENDKLINKGNPINFLIEGDNLAALKLLQKTHLEKIDFIYIDPPYNRKKGKNDFIYDDKYVDPLDSFKHSKWLSFMSKRLEIAKTLLSEKGIIFISIDDNEHAPLKIICDEIFNEKNYIGTIIWQSATDNNPRQISTEHEYILCFSKDYKKQTKWLLKSEKAQLIEDKYNELKAKSNDIKKIQSELRKWISENKESLKGVAHYKQVDEFGVYSDSTNSSDTKPGEYIFDIIHPITKKPCTKPAYGWRWPEETFWEYEKQGDIKWGIDETTQPHVKKRINTVDEQLKSIYYEDGRAATKQLELLFGKKKIFDNPKPINLISRLITFSSSKNATILDFFAGSGTTGHAVMQQNKIDGGTRKFILCTNNQNNICSDITYKRLMMSINNENYNASLKYYKIDYIPIYEKFYYEYADELLLHIRELVELENGIDFHNNSKIAIILNDEELSTFFTSRNFDNCLKLYLGHDILLTGEQEAIIRKNNIEIAIIPNYYYNELEE